MPVPHGGTGRRLPEGHRFARHRTPRRRIVLVGRGLGLGVLHMHGLQLVGSRSSTVLHLGRPTRLHLGREDVVVLEDDEIRVVLVALRCLLAPAGRHRLGLPTTTSRLREGWD